MPFNISAKIQGYLLKLLFVALCGLAVWGNFQMMAAKNKKIDEQGQSITKLEKEKKDLEDELKKKIKSDTVTVDLTATVRKDEAKVEKAKSEANKYVEKKLADIEAKYAQQEQNAVNLERKRTEISLERAKGLWLTFCLQEPQEQACKQ